MGGSGSRAACSSFRPTGAARTPGWSTQLPAILKLVSVTPAISFVHGQLNKKLFISSSICKHLPNTQKSKYLSCYVSGEKRETSNLDSLHTVQNSFDHIYADPEALEPKGELYLKVKYWLEHIDTDMMRQKFKYVLPSPISRSLCEREFILFQKLSFLDFT